MVAPAASAAIGLAALSSSACTIGAVVMIRKKLLWFFGDEALVNELSERGLDLTTLDAESRIEKQYDILETLGKGASGVVYKVRNRGDRKLFAMKVMEKGNNSMNDEESLMNEIRCMRRLRHRHIVNCVEMVQSDKKMWLFMDLATGGGLYERILALDHFSEKSAASVIKQVLKAVHYMHSMGVVHRDLKPENVLLESSDVDADIKVADFGLAVDMGWESYHPRESMKLKASTEIHGGFCGSPICMAPEVAVKSARYGPQCDVWSIGCMTYELLSGSPPFTAKSAKALFKIIRESASPSFKESSWTTLSSDSKEIVAGMLTTDPVARPSAREALHHNWFVNAKDHHNTDAHELIKSRRTQRRSDDDEDSDELDIPMSGSNCVKSPKGKSP